MGTIHSLRDFDRTQLAAASWSFDALTLLGLDGDRDQEGA